MLQSKGVFHTHTLTPTHPPLPTHTHKRNTHAVKSPPHAPPHCRDPFRPHIRTYAHTYIPAASCVGKGWRCRTRECLERSASPCMLSCLLGGVPTAWPLAMLWRLALMLDARKLGDAPTIHVGGVHVFHGMCVGVGGVG